MDKQAKDQFKKFLDEFKNESDRAAVILGVAKLDIQLRQILIQFLLPNPTNEDNLFDGDTPLSTFSSKINLAYRLGIISKNLSKALHLIRKIRNSFAHEIAGTTFESGGHADRVKELCLPLKQYPQYESFNKIVISGKNDVSSDFRVALTICVYSLELHYHETKTIIPENECDFIPSGWVQKEEVNKKVIKG